MKVAVLLAPLALAVGGSVKGRVVVSKAYGMADLEHDVANTPDTIFEAGSVSKQFTAAAVLLLAREGKLTLGDPVRKHVPELPDYAGPLTIRHMLMHMSGRERRPIDDGGRSAEVERELRQAHRGRRVVRRRAAAARAVQ